MLAMIVSVFLVQHCAICGGTHLDAVGMVQGEYVLYHDSEDAQPGDIYSVSVDGTELTEYLGYLY